MLVHATKTLVQAFFSCCLDYCNSLLLVDKRSSFKFDTHGNSEPTEVHQSVGDVIGAAQPVDQ